MSKPAEENFIVTREYRLFTEFCDACRRYRYIGLCYGPPGVGKTFSARHYANCDKVEAYQRHGQPSTVNLEEVLGSHTVCYTPKVVNAPKQIEDEIVKWRRNLRSICWDDISREEKIRRAAVRKLEEERYEKWFVEEDWLMGKPKHPSETGPTVKDVTIEYSEKRDATPDPTTLILVDEADRLRMAGLEQMRAIFDAGSIGLVLIGMPGLEKRLARYPQLYSRIGFVHEFHSLPKEEVHLLLEQRWQPPEVSSPLKGITEEEVVVSIVRITGGNFRLLHRLLTQIARIMEINATQTVTRQVVEAARESLVIGSS